MAAADAAATRTNAGQEGSLVAIIADEARSAVLFPFDTRVLAYGPLTQLAQDTITGFLLAGVGNVDLRRKSNFLIVDQSARRAARTCLGDAAG